MRGVEGHHAEACENTLLAFERAIALGANYLETDVHVSRDGVAILSHDPDLRRIAQQPQTIAELTFAELRAIDLGSGQTFASLADALKRFPSTRFNIDIKVSGAVGPVVSAIAETGATGRVLISSFSENRRRRAVRALPGVATSASAPLALIAVLLVTIGLRLIMRFLLRNVDAVQIPERIVGIQTSSPKMIHAFHQAGCEVHFWTINSAADMSRLLKSGADGVITDRADQALTVTAELE